MNKCKFCNKEHKSLRGLRSHLNRIHNFNWLNEIPVKKCKNPSCDKTLRKDDRHFYHNHSCQVSHQQTLKWEKYRKDEDFRNKYNENVKRKHKEKYGVEYIFQRPEVVKKVKQTKLKRYGDENYINIEKIKQTKLKKYGNENAFAWHSKEMNEILKKKYGNEFYANNKKAMKTILEKYGGIGFQLENNINKSIETKKKKSLEKFNIYLETAKLEQITKNKFQCLQCNFIFCKKNISQKAKYPICFKCNPTIGTSKFEKEIIEFIKSININDNIYHRYRYLRDENNKSIELDIFLEKRKIAIETNGNYHHSELGGNKDKNYHLKKTKICQDNKIQLIQIFEDEWRLKKDIVKSRLISIFNLNDEKIYARKCIIKEVSVHEKDIFLQKYHIQGIDNSSIRLGAFYNNELISVMTFGKLRISLGSRDVKNEYELIRFCSSKNIIGIASKLLSHFIKNYHPKKIITYADKRWSNGNLYKKIGFDLIKETTPNYWYVNKKAYIDRIHRFNYRKNVLSKKLKTFNPKLTEWENMQLNGFDRIWDCGHYKFELNI